MTSTNGKQEFPKYLKFCKSICDCNQIASEDCIDEAIEMYRRDWVENYTYDGTKETDGIRCLLGKNTYQWHFFCNHYRFIDEREPTPEIPRGYHFLLMPSTFLGKKDEDIKQLYNQLGLKYNSDELSNDSDEKEKKKWKEEIMKSLNEELSKETNTITCQKFITESNDMNSVECGPQESIIPLEYSVECGPQESIIPLKYGEYVKRTKTMKRRIEAIPEEAPSTYKDEPEKEGKISKRIRVVKWFYAPILAENPDCFVFDVPLYHDSIFFGWLMFFLKKDVIQADEHLEEVARRLNRGRAIISERIWFQTQINITDPAGTNTTAEGLYNDADKKTLNMCSRIAFTLKLPHLTPSYDDKKITFSENPKPEEDFTDPYEFHVCYKGRQGKRDQDLFTFIFQYPKKQVPHFIQRTLEILKHEASNAYRIASKIPLSKEKKANEPSKAGNGEKPKLKKVCVIEVLTDQLKDDFYDFRSSVLGNKESPKEGIKSWIEKNGDNVKKQIYDNKLLLNNFEKYDRHYKKLSREKIAKKVAAMCGQECSLSTVKKVIGKDIRGKNIWEQYQLFWKFIEDIAKSNHIEARTTKTVQLNDSHLVETDGKIHKNPRRVKPVT
ncbi:MAG: hypothetical protein LBQ54_15670 [Planctomycetaceae bacterium]|jgi:hypothetical protein|nr:hypothetical protein [Planctomycetaceae bacterium]